MKRFYLTEQEFNSGTIFGEEYNHIKNVLRMKEGDLFIAFINTEEDYTCKITSIDKKEIRFEVVSSSKNVANPKIQIDVFEALAKGEKMELIAQKLTEIGVSNIYPLYIKNCDVKPNTTKTQRLEKIIISAAKQCGRSKLTFVHEIVDFKKSLNILKNYDLVLFANETEHKATIYDLLTKHKNARKIAYIIGPEGGFTPEEIEEYKKVAKSVSLGKRILRTETASIYLASILNDFYRN